MSNKGKNPSEVEFNTLVGKNIKHLRKLKKLTQTKVGSAIGVSFQQVQKYENGKNGLHSYSLHKIAHKVFNVSMDVLADPQMIIKHEGFGEVIGTTKTPQDAGYLKPQKGIGSLEEIKKELEEWR